MAVKISSITSVGNGRDGIRIEGDVDFESDVIHTENNGGHGINIIKHAGIMKQFGLPTDTDPMVLAKLLVAIREAPDHKKEDVIRSSSLWGKFSVGALSTTTLIANLITFTGGPQAVQYIMTLMK